MADLQSALEDSQQQTAQEQARLHAAHSEGAQIQACLEAVQQQVVEAHEQLQGAEAALAATKAEVASLQVRCCVPAVIDSICGRCGAVLGWAQLGHQRTCNSNVAKRCTWVMPEFKGAVLPCRSNSASLCWPVSCGQLQRGNLTVTCHMQERLYASHCDCHQGQAMLEASQRQVVDAQTEAEGLQQQLVATQAKDAQDYQQLQEQARAAAVAHDQVTALG